MKKLLGTTLALLPSLASAHPGHVHTLASVFSQPFAALDHFLFVVAVSLSVGYGIFSLCRFFVLRGEKKSSH